MLSRRRIVLQGLPAAAATAAAAAAAQGQVSAPAVHRDPEQRFAGGVDMRVFAEPSSTKPQGEPLQAALDAAYAASAPLFLGKGEYVTDRPLAIRNTSVRDRAMPWILGRGIGETVIAATPFAGAILTVRGVAEGPLKRGHFLRGGGLGDLEIRGLANYQRDPEPVQHGLAVMGWWHGALESVRIKQLTGDGLVSFGDTGVDPNPDWTAVILALTGVSIERVRGWAFRDDNPIGSTGWVWTQCILQVAGLGGALVRSSGHKFIGCSFSACGWIAEGQPGPGEDGISVHLLGSLDRTHIADCEFDTARTIHLALDNTHASTIERTRFIHHDRYGAGHLTPPLGVAFARAGDRSAISGVEFRRTLFRIDTPGEMTGFKWFSTANVVDVDIQGVRWGDQTGGKVRLVKFDGHDRRNHNVIQNFRLDDGRTVHSAGAVPAFLKARHGALRLAAGAAVALTGWTQSRDQAVASSGSLGLAPKGEGFELPATGWWDIDAGISGGTASARAVAGLRLVVAGVEMETARGEFGPGVQTVRLSDRFLGRAGDTVALHLICETPGSELVVTGGTLLVRLAPGR